MRSLKSRPLLAKHLAMKVNMHDAKRKLSLSAVMAAEFRVLDVTARLLEAAAELPRHHADPFDRVLIARALQDDLSVLTRDAAFADYGVRLAPTNA